MLFVAASIIIATISYRKNKLSFFGVFWIYGTLAVESSFIPVADVMNEHRLYIPMFGFALILIDLLHTILKDEKRLKSVVIFLLLLISFYSIKTLVRNNDWNTEYSLWSDAATKSPNKARAQFKKGVAALEQGLIPVAMESFQKTIALYPKFPSVYSYLGAIYFYSANYPLSIINYTTFIQLSHPRNKPDGIISRARAFTKMNMMDSAKKDYNLYLSLRPKDSIALREVSAFYNSLGQKDSISAIYALVANRDKGNFGATFQLAMEYLNKKDYNKALTYLNMLVDNESLDNVKKSEIYNLRAATYFYQNNMVDAAIDYENAVALNPKYIEGWRNKAMLHRNLKEYELEMESINKLDGLLPGEPQVAFLKGRNLYKQGKIKEAKPYLLRFLKSQPNHQETKDILNKIK